VLQMAKFTSLDGNGNNIDHDYGDRYFRQPSGDTHRLVIGTSGSNIQLLDALAAVYGQQQYFALYVLLLSHAGRPPGRYQSPIIANHEDLQVFLYSFQEFFEGDGRHHLWIGSPGCSDLLVYDQHDVVFAYGSIDIFEEVLIERGFTEEEFWFPSPHSHSFDPANVREEDAVLACFDWQFFELQPGDEWD